MKALSIHSIPIPSDHHRSSHDGTTGQAARIKAVLPGYAQLAASMIDEDTLLIQEKLPINPTQRLVVLVPPGEIDETILARRVWQLAANSCFRVLYLAMARDDAPTAYQRGRLVGLAAFTSGQKVYAQASVSTEKNWRKALEQILQPGDLLVCLASHQVSEHLFWHRKLGEELAETVGVPVYLLGGIKIGQTARARQAIKDVVAWTSFLSLIAVFFSLQVGIDHITTGSLATILICLSVIVEIYLLWKINEWTG